MNNKYLVQQRNGDGRGGDVDDDDDVVVVVSSYRSEGTDTRAEVLFRMVRERVLIGFG